MDTDENRGGVPAANAAIYARSAQDPSSTNDQIRVCKSYAEQMGLRIDDTEIFTDTGCSGVTITAQPGLTGLLDAARRGPRPFAMVIMRNLSRLGQRLTKASRVLGILQARNAGSDQSSRDNQVLTAWPGLTRLLDAAKRRPRPFAMVVMQDPSRLGRSLTDVLHVLGILEALGISICFVDLGLEASSESVRQLLNMRSSASYIESRSNVVRRDQKARVMQGFVHGGHRYGYDNVPVVDPTRKVGGRPLVIGYRATINPAEAAVVKRTFELRGQGLSLRRIALMLTMEAAPSPGNALRARWTESKVRAILKNPIYLGRLVYGRTRSYRHPRTGKILIKHLPPAEWLVRDAPDLRLVTDEQWRSATDVNRPDGDIQRKDNTDPRV